MASYDPPDWVERNKGAARTAFERAASLQKPAAEIERAPKPAEAKPALKLEMKGPIGEAVRKDVAAERNAGVLRAQKLAAGHKAAGLEKDARENRAGAVYEAKKSQGVNVPDLKSALAKAAKGEEQSIVAAAEQKSRGGIERALKLANEFNGVAKSKENER